MMTTTNPRYFTVLAREIARMQKILAEGLPKCYSDWQDFLIDWGCDFSWTPDTTLIQLNELLESKEWLDLAEKVKSSHGHDFYAEVRVFIEESKADGQD